MHTLTAPPETERNPPRPPRLSKPPCASAPPSQTSHNAQHGTEHTAQSTQQQTPHRPPTHTQRIGRQHIHTHTHIHIHTHNASATNTCTYKIQTRAHLARALRPVERLVQLRDGAALERRDVAARQDRVVEAGLGLVMVSNGVVVWWSVIDGGGLVVGDHEGGLVGRAMGRRRRPRRQIGCALCLPSRPCTPPTQPPLLSQQENIAPRTRSCARGASRRASCRCRAARRRACGGTARRGASCWRPSRRASGPAQSWLLFIVVNDCLVKFQASFVSVEFFGGGAKKVCVRVSRVQCARVVWTAF